MTPELEKLTVLLGQRLNALRKKMGLKQSAFAHLMGTSDETLSEIEKGRKLPSLKMLCALSELLEMTLSQLVDFQDETKARPTVNQPLATHILNIKTKTPAEVRWFQNLARVAFNYPHTKNVGVGVNPKRKRKRGR